VASDGAAADTLAPMSSTGSAARRSAVVLDLVVGIAFVVLSAGVTAVAAIYGGRMPVAVGIPVIIASVLLWIGGLVLLVRARRTGRVGFHWPLLALVATLAALYGGLAITAAVLS